MTQRFIKNLYIFFISKNNYSNNTIRKKNIAKKNKMFSNLQIGK